MKLLFLLLNVFFIFNFAYSQLLLEENFEYDINTELVNTGNWDIQTPANNTNPLTVTQGNLLYPLYINENLGNYLLINNIGQDCYRSFSSQNGITVYVSFLINVLTAQTNGDYFFALEPTPGSTNFTGRFFIKKDTNNKLAFGISKGTETAVYSAFNYELNTTYLIVIKYQMISGPQNDLISVFIDPPVGQSEPENPVISTTGGLTSDPLTLAAILLRQGSNTGAPTLYIDAIRVGTSWQTTVNKEVNPPVITFNPSNGTINFDVYSQLIITSDKPLRNIDDSEIDNSNVHNLILFKKENLDGEDVNFSASINTEKTQITINPVNHLSFSTTYFVKFLPVEDYNNNATTEQIIIFSTRAASTEANIISFIIPNQLSSNISNQMQRVEVVMPNGTDLTSLTPEIIVSPGATIYPPSGMPQNFSTPFTYYVTAEDGITIKEWLVFVSYQYSSDAEIISFEIPAQISSTINSAAATVNVLMPYGTDLTNLTPEIIVSPGATISPASGITQDFTNPVIYTVTAEDGITSKEWTVTVTTEEQPYITLVEWTFPNNPDDSLADGGISANLDKVITCTASGTVTYNYAGATTNCARATGWDNGADTKYWRIDFTTVGYKDIKVSSKQRSSSTGPRNFKLQYMINNSNQWIDVQGANITCADNFTTGVLTDFALPEECNQKELVSLRWIMTDNISVGGGTVASTGASRIDDIIVVGTPALNDEADILSFNIPDQITSSINYNDTSVMVLMPFGTDLTNLIPIITISPGATINPPSNTPQNFTTPVIYTVTSESGVNKKYWKASVIVGLNNQADILFFEIPGQISSNINYLDTTISVLMPYGTDLTSLVPVIIISDGATITPPGGVAQDFSVPVIYIVTAQDGITVKKWVVTVTTELPQYEVIVEWTFPNNPDDSLADGGISANLDKVITCTASGTVTYNYAGATTNCARATGWDNGADTKYWRVDFTTIGYKDILVSSKQRSSATGPRDFKLQYMIDNDGNWYDLENSTIVCADNFTSGVLNDLLLPEICNHKSLVSLRWIMTTNTSVSGSVVASSGASRIDDIIIKGIYDGVGNYDQIDEDIEIYPNPVSDWLYVKTNNFIKIYVIDISGKEILVTSEKYINVSYLYKGVYLIKVISNNKMKIYKLIKR